MMGKVLRSVKGCALTVAESLFPDEMYARRIRRWTKQEAEISLLPVLCRGDADSLDIGANQGLFVWHLLPISKGVVAFEPLPPMLAVLRSRYGSQIRLEGVILSDHEGRGELRYPAGNYMLATVTESQSGLFATDQEMERVAAPMKTLDSFALRNIGFIKIDVEGHEEAVLRGAAGTLRQERPNILVEIEERHSRGALRRVAKLLADNGYSGFYLDDHKVLDISRFDPALDQPIGNVSAERGKTGRYINNFMFFPQSKAADIVTMLQFIISNETGLYSRESLAGAR